jgi:outer membrane protein OmpA-like peptidoglycan-associated protein
MRICALFFLSILLVLSGCAAKTLVVLVPDRDGSTGRIVVKNTAGSVAIEQPNQAVTVREGAAPGAPKEMRQEDIDASFSQVIAGEPTLPEHFILYFETSGTRLTSESMALSPNIFASIKNRSSTDISIVGHTDTVGDEHENMILSQSRADAVMTLLMEQGLAPDAIRTTSHGEGNLLIKTGDNVDEPKNRRVEVIVR